MGLNNSLGASKVTTLVFAAIIIAAGYVGYRITPFYYYNFELQNQIEQLVKIAPNEKPIYIRKRVLEMVKRYEIPIDPDRISIEQTGNGVAISIPYTEILDISWQGKYYDLYEFKFHAQAQTR